MPHPICTCSMQQLHLVGCDCDAGTVYIVEYWREGCHRMEIIDRYDSYVRAATIATAVENRGYKTNIKQGWR